VFIKIVMVEEECVVVRQSRPACAGLSIATWSSARERTTAGGIGSPFTAKKLASRVSDWTARRRVLAG
jgi:hypothetical protein